MDAAAVKFNISLTWVLFAFSSSLLSFSIFPLIYLKFHKSCSLSSPYFFDTPIYFSMFTAFISFYVLLIYPLHSYFAFTFSIITPLFFSLSLSFSLVSPSFFSTSQLLAWFSDDRWRHGGIIQVKMTGTDRPTEGILGRCSTSLTCAHSLMRTHPHIHLPKLLHASSDICCAITVHCIH